MNIEWFCC